MIAILKRQDAWISEHASLPFCVLMFRRFAIRPLRLSQLLILMATAACVWSLRNSRPIFLIAAIVFGLLAWGFIARLKGDWWAQSLPVANEEYTDAIRVLLVGCIWMNAVLVGMGAFLEPIDVQTFQRGVLDILALTVADVLGLVCFHILAKDAKEKGLA